MSEETNSTTELEKEQREALDEASTETTEKTSTKASDYKVIVELIKEMEIQIQTLKDFSATYVKTTYNMPVEVFMGIMPFGPSAIDTMDETTLRGFLTKFGSEENTEKILAEAKVPTEEGLHELSDIDALRKIMKDIKQSQLSILAAEEESENLKKESNEILSEYIDYMSSPKVTEARKKRLDSYKELAEKETDPKAKEKIINMIHQMDAAYSISFIFTRFNKFGDKEIQSIKEAFFDEKKGSYVMDRFAHNIKKFGYSDMLYKYFFNIEEHFLGEEYYCFNNLFLFSYMRFVAYADPYRNEDKMYVQALTASLANLIYHKFVSTDGEQAFIGVIKEFDEKFRNDEAYWTENNTTNPDHPQRIKAAAAHEIQRKETLIKKMDELKITGYDIEASADELQKYMNDALDAMIKEQMNEQKNQQTVTESDENGSKIIRPDFGKTTDDVVEDVNTDIDAVAIAEDEVKVQTMDISQLGLSTIDVKTGENLEFAKEEKAPMATVPFLITEGGIASNFTIEDLVNMPNSPEPVVEEDGRRYVFIDGKKYYFPQ